MASAAKKSTVPEENPLRGTSLAGGATRRFLTEKADSTAKKPRVSFHLTEGLADRIRNAVWHLAGPPYRLNLSALAEQALEREVKRLEDQANDGKPFPKRDAELVGGRPLGR